MPKRKKVDVRALVVRAKSTLENPKDAVSGTKVPLHLCPNTILIAGAMAFLEGGLKYGAHNWRCAGVRSSVYYTALLDHIMAWWNGAYIDPDSGLPHLWKALACIAIMIDADMIGKLIDDRPPAAEIDEVLKALRPHVKAIKERLKEHNPRHFSLADAPNMPPIPKWLKP